MAKLKESFNLKSFGRTLMAIGIKEIPCLLLTFGGTAVGLSFLNHNAALELVMALTISLATEYVAENYVFKKEKCCADHPAERKVFGLMTPKGLLFAVTIGVSTWWAHGLLLHDEHKNHVQNQQIERPHNHADLRDQGHEHDHDHGAQERTKVAEPLLRHQLRL